MLCARVRLNAVAIDELRLVRFTSTFYVPAPCRTWMFVWNEAEDAGMRCCGWTLAGVALCVTAMGCALTHEAQPHRLWRFNRGPGPSSNPYFSVSDLPPQSAANTTGWTPHKLADAAHEPPVADLD